MVQPILGILCGESSHTNILVIGRPDPLSLAIEEQFYLVWPTLLLTLLLAGRWLLRGRPVRLPVLGQQAPGEFRSTRHRSRDWN
jgi:hypothetical protein